MCVSQMARGDSIRPNGSIFLLVGWICCFVICSFTSFFSLPASTYLSFTYCGNPTWDGRLPRACSILSRMSMFSIPLRGLIREFAWVNRFYRYLLERDAFFGLVLSANRTNNILFWIILCRLCLISSSDIWLIVCLTVCSRLRISSFKPTVGARGVYAISGTSKWVSLKASSWSTCLRCLFSSIARVLLVEMVGRHMALLDLLFKMYFYSASVMSSIIILIRWRVRNITSDISSISRKSRRLGRTSVLTKRQSWVWSDDWKSSKVLWISATRIFRIS